MDHSGSGIVHVCYSQSRESPDSYSIRQNTQRNIASLVKQNGPRQTRIKSKPNIIKLNLNNIIISQNKALEYLQDTIYPVLKKLKLKITVIQSKITAHAEKQKNVTHNEVKKIKERHRYDINDTIIRKRHLKTLITLFLILKKEKEYIK